MIRAIRPSAMAQDDAILISGWNVAPNLAYVLRLLPGPASCGVLLYDEVGSTLIATGAALVGTAQPCVLLPQAGRSVGMVDADLGWHLLLTTTGTESQRTIRLGPAVDLPDEIHPVYGDDDLALARATAAIDAAAHYIDDVTVTCPLGLGAGLGDVVSVPVDGVAVVGQVESITWTATPDGTMEQAVIRRHVAIAPEAFVEITPPTVADDTGITTHLVETSGNVLANDDSGLTIVAVNGLSTAVGTEVTGDNGGLFVIGADGSWTFDPNGDFDLLDVAETADTRVTYHASNGTAEAGAMLTVTVSRSNSTPVAVDDAGTTDASTTTSGNVLTNDTDTDPLTVSKVAGSAGNVGIDVAGSNGGVFTIMSDGAWTFDPDGDFYNLSVGTTTTTSVTYHASDGLEEDEGVLTVTVSAVDIPLDDMWDDVVLCINASGADGSTTITDAKGATISRFGDTQIDTALGYPAIQFDGTGDYLTVPNVAANRLEQGVFTYDEWIYFDGTSKRMGLVGTRPPAVNAGCVIHVQSNNTIRLFMTGGGLLASTGTISAGLHHVEVSIDLHRTCRIFIGGVLAGSGVVGEGAVSSSPLQIGREQDGVSSEFLQARVPALRIKRGWRVRHTGNFTPPEYPFGETQATRYSASLGDISDILIWLDASDAQALDMSASTWVVRDKTGQGRDFAQDASGYRPALQANAINGKSALYFGGDDYIYCPLSAIPGITVNSPLAVFAAFKGDGATGFADFAMATRVNLYVNNDDEGWLIDADTKTRFAHTGHGELSKTSALTRGNVCICAWEIGANAATPALYVDSAAVTPTTNTIAAGAAEDSRGFLVIGRQSTSFMKGLLGELVVMSRMPASSERATIINHLIANWRA